VPRSGLERKAPAARRILRVSQQKVVGPTALAQEWRKSSPNRKKTPGHMQQMREVSSDERDAVAAERRNGEVAESAANWSNEVRKESST